ncbi:hypothetical protein C5167_027868 [Papaver somniferum]|nr:hypothetical protein C5167_027868 [Papaver somniferum]
MSTTGTVSVQYHPIARFIGLENDKFSVSHPKLEFPRSKFLRFNLRSADNTRRGCIGRVRAVPEADDFFWEKALTPSLDMVETPGHLKNLSIKELKQLADEIRSELSFIMSKMPRRFKASLATVELTVALHHVFDTPTDKILWDVGQQVGTYFVDGAMAYAHKILTGRRSLMHTLRQKNGLSGFTSRIESEFDAFGAAHGCNSISAGLGIAVARDIKGMHDRVVTVISNETTMSGQVYEAMSNAGYLDSNMVVILNDSRHSLHPKLDENPKSAINALSSTLSKLQSSKSFRQLREAAKGVTHELVAKVDEYARGMMGPRGATLFEELGLYYIGPVLVHVITEEMQGLEDDQQKEASIKHQGSSSSDSLASYPKLNGNSFSRTCSDYFVEALVMEAERDKDIIIHDVDQQRIPVRFAISSAGQVGSDGPTQCGAFDITFMSCLPNMIVMAPSDEDELVNMVATAAQIDDRPIGKGKILAEGKDTAFLGYGVMVQNCLKARSPLSGLGIQEGSAGGFGSHVAQFISLDGQLDRRVKWRPIALPDNYIKHASPKEQLVLAGLTGHHIAATALSLLGRTRDALLLMRLRVYIYNYYLDKKRVHFQTKTFHGRDSFKSGS